MLKTDLSGRVVVVTNADTPLGVQLCREYAANGAKVAVCYRANGCDKCRKEAAEAAGAEGFSVELDYNNEASLEETAKAIFEHFGKIDVLANNELHTFVNMERVITHDVDIEKFDKLVNSAIKNFARFTRYITLYMSEVKKGVIVNITSIKGVVAVEEQPLAVSVASTQVGLGKIWGSELRNFNIRSNVIAAGFCEYEDKAGIPDEIRFSHCPIKRPAKLEEIADTAMFMSGDESSFITATILPVDGGLCTGFARSF